ncbi:hypothetical protein EW026_g1344 [Hermanssonia centrifuga]|uniref:Uncharacterized protein n=1 Tax=Hermanssonia centrifuga TaxID=98765 RepID=A0A4S4KSQ8_9APHY|nr:hypothetical protein EW026_g1344 [Hermanssonia centrifuga]
MWFERGAEYGEKECHNGLGMIWRDGLVDGKKDMKKALLHFGAAASQDLAEALVHLGKYYYSRGELKAATAYFENAIRQGSPFEAYYYLANIQSRQIKTTGTPSEIADKSILRFTRFAPTSPSNDTARLALTQWTRSAAQRNTDALVKVGDYYYHGLGVGDEPENTRWEKAVGYYQSAADTHLSALAMWNLGWMYEHGLGVPQDFHLAKRHYDSALATNGEAYIPAMLSLVKLHAKSLWYTILGGSDTLNLWRYEEEHVYQTAPEQQKIEDGQEPEASTGQGNDDHYEDEDDGNWYIGKARENFNRRRQHQDTREIGQDPDDPVQWARERRRAESEREGDFGPDDYFDGAMRGGYRGEEDVDEFAETMLLVVLCLTVSGLLYFRGRWVERLRREEQRRQQQQPQQNGVAQGPQPQPQGGLYPPPGDPARDNWAILR